MADSGERKPHDTLALSLSVEKWADYREALERSGDGDERLRDLAERIDAMMPAQARRDAGRSPEDTRYQDRGRTDSRPES